MMICTLCKLFYKRFSFYRAFGKIMYYELYEGNVAKGINICTMLDIGFWVCKNLSTSIQDFPYI